MRFWKVWKETAGQWSEVWAACAFAGLATVASTFVGGSLWLLWRAWKEVRWKEYQALLRDFQTWGLSEKEYARLRELDRVYGTDNRVSYQEWKASRAIPETVTVRPVQQQVENQVSR